jgi:DNA-3-methyladenine glycosylase II
MHTRAIVVPVTQPFDLELASQFLDGFSPLAGEVGLGGGAIVKSWLTRGQPVTATIRAGDGGLACALASPAPIGDDAARALADRVAELLSARDDVGEFYALAARDRAFAPVAERLRGLHHPKFSTPFEAACWALINQRIDLRRARAMKAALVARFGAPGCDAFPEAAALAAAGERALAATVGHERKGRALAAAAQAFAAVDEAWLRAAPLAAVEDWLRRIWGVGDFTAAFVLYRGLGRALPPPLGLPWSDKFVDAARATYGRAVTRADLVHKGAPFGPWVGYWSLYLYASSFVRAPAQGSSVSTKARKRPMASSHCAAISSR